MATDNPFSLFAQTIQNCLRNTFEICRERENHN